MSVDAVDLDPDKLPPIADPQVAGPAVDPAQAQAQIQVQAPAQAAAQGQGAIAKRPYVPDFVNKPGAQRSQDEKAAVGSPLASKARAVADFAQSLPVSMIGSGASAFAGGNPAEALAHAAQMTEIMATAHAQNDPVAQAAFKAAQDKNRAEKSALSSSMEMVRAADSGKVGDKSIDEILADPGAHTQDEVTIASQARNHIKRRERNPGKSDAELLRATPFGGRTKRAVTSVMANMTLGVKGDAIGAKKIQELTPEQTLGTEVSPDLVKDGHVVSRDSRPQNSWGASISNFFSSLNPWSSRPIGNTATLTESEQKQAAASENKAGRWQALADQRNLQRTVHELSGNLQGGYTAEEFKRKSELKDQISTLEGTAKSEKSARSRWFRGPRFNEQEQQRYDSWGTLVSDQDARVKTSQEAAIAGHQSELDTLEEAKAASLGQRSRNWLPWKSGAYHFTDDEQTAHSALQAKVDAITTAAQGRELTSDEQRDLAKHREDMHEMEQVRDTGLTRAQRQKYSSLQTSIAATKSNSLFGLDASDITARHVATSERAEMKTTLKTGLTKDQREELQKAKDEREEQRQYKKTGLTKVERENKSAAEKEAKDVYRDAAAKDEFLDTHGGKAVRETALGGGKKEYRVGGLKHEGVTDEDTKTTAGGWLAQAGRTVSGWFSFLGELISGKSSDAKKHIQKGDLGKAAAISASGLTKEGLAFGGNVALPGVGGKALRHFTEGVGSGVKGISDAGHAAFDSAASGQDLRDEQGKLISGERGKEASENAIDWHGAVPHEKKDTGKKIGMGLGQAALGAASAFAATNQGSEIKQSALEFADDKASSAWASTQRAVGLTPTESAPASPLRKGAQSFAEAAVTDNFVHMGKSAHSALSSHDDGPSLEAQIDSAQSRAQLEQDRAASRADQDAAPGRAAQNVAQRDSRRAANNAAAFAELPFPDGFDDAAPAAARTNAADAPQALPTEPIHDRTGNDALEQLHPDDMEADAKQAPSHQEEALPTEPIHDRTGNDALEQLHPDDMEADSK